MNYQDGNPICKRTFSRRRLGWLLPAALCLALAIAPGADGAVGIETAAEPNDVYQGETVTLTVRISDFADGMEPDLSRVPANGVTLLGQRDESHQSITIINGRQQINTFSGRLFQYRLTPVRIGAYNLGPVLVTAGGSTVATSPGPAITVRTIPRQDTVLLFLEPSKPQVILDEPFTVTLRILVRRLAAPYANESPLPAQAPPFLSIPYLDQTEDSGIESENIQERLNRMLVADGEAFRINSFGVGGSPFGSLFGPQVQARFRLERQAVEHNGLPYFEYTFPLLYTPRREGRFAFGPVVFKGPVFTHVTPAGEGRVETVYAIAEAIAVQVTSPPAEGRPETYIDAIGSNLVVSATIDAQTCFTGDPLTLTIDISGGVRLDAITAPRLAGQTALHQDFRIYEDTVQRESLENSRRYRFTIRPSKAGTLEFPPVAVSYYDTLTSTYRTVFTEPIPVRANAVTEIQSDIVIRTGDRGITITAEADEEASRLVPAPVEMVDRLTAQEHVFIPRLHIPLLAAGPLLYLAGLLWRLMRRFYPQWKAHRRRRSAAAVAIHQIRKAERHAGGTGTEPHLQIAEAMRGYLQTQCGERVRAATPGECEQILCSTGIAPETAARFARLLEACTHAAFSRGPDTLAAPAPAASKEAESLITALDAALRQIRRETRRRPNRILPAAGLLLLLCALPAELRADNRLSSDFEAQRAITVLLSAAQPEEFAEAADAFAALIDQGAANAGLFYNYGTALLMAGEPAAALEALNRAERYSGTTWGIRRNMLLARRALNEEVPASLPWYRGPLFWHYRLPAAVRMTIAASAFLAVWLTVLLPYRRLREIVIPAAVLAAAVCLLFGASVLSSVYSEHQSAIAHVQRPLPSETEVTP